MRPSRNIRNLILHQVVALYSSPRKILFNQFVDRVAKTFSMRDPEAMFLRTKRQDVVDARQLLCYLCSARDISLADIRRLMEDRGLPGVGLSAGG